MQTNDDQTFYISIREKDVDKLAELGPALHFYLWMINNRYMREGAEEIPFIGPWIKRGLVVTSFYRSRYAQIGDCHPRTVTRYLARLEELGYIKVVSTGSKQGDENGTPLVVALGVWRWEGPKAERTRRAYYHGWLEMLEEVDGDTPSRRPSVDDLKTIRRDNNKTSRIKSEGEEIPLDKNVQTPPLDKNVQTPLDKNG